MPGCKNSSHDGWTKGKLFIFPKIDRLVLDDMILRYSKFISFSTHLSNHFKNKYLK